VDRGGPPSDDPITRDRVSGESQCWNEFRQGQPDDGSVRRPGRWSDLAPVLSCLLETAGGLFHFSPDTVGGRDPGFVMTGDSDRTAGLPLWSSPWHSRPAGRNHRHRCPERSRRRHVGLDRHEPDVRDRFRRRLRGEHGDRTARVCGVGTHSILRRPLAPS
jgi:hypothetical protein